MLSMFISMLHSCVVYFRGCNLSEVGGVLTHKQTLSSEVAQLVQEERRLDEMIQRCTQEVKQMTESSHSQKYPFFMLVQEDDSSLLGCVCSLCGFASWHAAYLLSVWISVYCSDFEDHSHDKGENWVKSWSGKGMGSLGKGRNLIMLGKEKTWEDWHGENLGGLSMRVENRVALVFFWGVGVSTWAILVKGEHW